MTKTKGQKQGRRKKTAEALRRRIDRLETTSAPNDDKFVQEIAKRLIESAKNLQKMAKTSPAFSKDQWKKIKKGLLVGAEIVKVAEGVFLVGTELGTQDTELKHGVTRLGQLKIQF